jgi:hypothetical protein
MALRQGPDVLSGSIGGWTFSHNRGGRYVRQRVVPTNPSSAKQQLARASLSSSAKLWTTLTAVQRSQWAVYAQEHPVPNRLGEMITLSGFGWYCRANGLLRSIGLTVRSIPPDLETPPSLLTASGVIVAGGATVTVSYTATPLAAGHYLVLWQAPPSPGVTNPNFAQARLCGASAAAAASPQVMPLAMVIGTTNQSRCFAAVYNNQGLASPPLAFVVTGT